MLQQLATIEKRKRPLSSWQMMGERRREEQRNGDLSPPPLALVSFLLLLFPWLSLLFRKAHCGGCGASNGDVQCESISRHA